MGLLKRFGKNIKIYRELKKLTQEELAEKINISTGSLSRIEGGRQFVKSQTLEKLARELDISISKLFNCTDNTSNSENKTELLQYIEALNETELEYILEQIKVYSKLKRKLLEA